MGIPPFKIAAPVLSVRDSEATLRVKRLPMCTFENGRLFGRASLFTRRLDEHHDENRPSKFVSPPLASACKDRGLYLEAAVLVRGAI